MSQPFSFTNLTLVFLLLLSATTFVQFASGFIMPRRRAPQCLIVRQQAMKRESLEMASPDPSSSTFKITPGPRKNQKFVMSDIPSSSISRPPQKRDYFTETDHFIDHTDQFRDNRYKNCASLLVPLLASARNQLLAAAGSRGALPQSRSVRVLLSSRGSGIYPTT